MFRLRCNGMKRLLAVLAILIVALLLFAALVVNYEDDDAETVFVGVTYCGDSVEEGKMLVDKVKVYTNLFVLQSGTLQRDLESVNELGDYAVSAGMYFLPYFGHYIEETFSVWLEAAKQRWGTHLLGVYYADEPGGKMLDDYVEFRNTTNGDSIMKTRYGDVVLEKADGVVIHYERDGAIHLYLPSSNQSGSTNGTETGVYVTLYPDGAIEAAESCDLPDYATYEGLLSMRPLKNVHDTADRFTALNRDSIKFVGDSTTVFTSDYALYWFDYLKGYDVVLTHVGWNHTLNRHLALTRGAARLQNKDWGIVITWKYKSPPYLDSGEEVLNQLTTAYECGAKYFVVFNYYDGSSPYGTMEDEHFAALESFWNDVVKDSGVVYGSVKADAVLVLPRNYGWGMRSPDDKIWGIFKPDNQTQTISDVMAHILEEHDLKVDIVYDDPDFPLPQEYQQVYYWNQTHDNN
jgi:hypothetical protein